MRTNDLRGRTFGRLNVIERVGSNRFNQAIWKCRCECGNETIVVGSAMLCGTTKSCGCLKVSGLSNFRHGHKRLSGASRTYKCWQNMLTRCTNPNTRQWKDYGGRGIGVCKRWHKFENFLADMGEAPADGKLSLDRLNNNKGYSKANCAWRTRSQQRRNSRGHMVYVVLDGKKMILKDAIAKARVVPYQTAVSRLYLGWSPYDAVMTPFTRSDNKGFR